MSYEYGICHMHQLSVGSAHTSAAEEYHTLAGPVRSEIKRLAVCLLY
jgi:hypothetical protein